MKWNPFDLIEPSFAQTKKKLFPINKSLWLKLGLIALLAGVSTSSCSSSVDADDFSSDSQAVDGSVNQAIVFGTAFTSSEWFVPVISVGLLLILVILFVRSMFSFVLLESILKKKIGIMKSASANRQRAWSYFSFSVLFTVIFLTVLAVLVVLILSFVFRFVDDPGLISQLPVVQWIMSIEVSLLQAVLISGLCIVTLIAMLVFHSLVTHFSFVHMYTKNKRILQSIAETFAKMRSSPGSVFFFLVARFLILILFGIVTGVVSFILVLPLIVFFVVLGVIAFSAGLAPTASVGIGIGLGALLGIGFGYVLSVVLLPLTVFSIYFTIENYKKLMK